MGLFNKKPKDTAPEPEVQTEPSFSYPVEIKFWDRDRILQIVEQIDLNEMDNGKLSTFLRCNLVPEPDNEFDPNAVKVFAGVKGTKTQDLIDIGYIPSEFTQIIKEDNKKVLQKSHFWSLRMIIDLFHGIKFLLYLKESKF